MSDHRLGRAVCRALLRHPTAGGRRWLRFDEPLETITAWELTEVLPALGRAELAAAEGRWVVGMVAYDAAPAFDRALVARRDRSVPLVAFGVFANALPSLGPAGGEYVLSDWDPGCTRAGYEEQIERVRSLIAAGETYQVNYTVRMRARFIGDPGGLFAALARAQRAEHMAFVDLGDAAVCSASPELFWHRSGSHVEARPMKGTRPRHPDPVVDRLTIDDLVSDPKDRAENTMIVDMMRNDLGRVAEIGSLAVPALHTVETYPTVHQLTSTVTADTEASLADLFAATFPGASVTGAPKIRTSEIIAELESEPRGVYTGAVGAVAPGGSAEFNIAIRTVWVDSLRGAATYGVGGGIVWDSTPAAEWQEVRDKCRVLERTRKPFRLLETMRYEPHAGIVLLDRHLDRLRMSADHFGYDVNLAEVRRSLDTVRAGEPSLVRLLVDVDGAIEVVVAPLPAADSVPWPVPIDAEPIHSGDELLFHKTTRRERYDAARDRFPDAPDVLLWNERGELTETTIGNVVVELDGQLLTPPVAAGLLPGTFRAELLDAGTIVERVVPVHDLPRAERIWMINSLRGWVVIEPVHDQGTTVRAMRGTPGR